MAMRLTEVPGVFGHDRLHARSIRSRGRHSAARADVERPPSICARQVACCKLRECAPERLRAFKVRWTIPRRLRICEIQPAVIVHGASMSACAPAKNASAKPRGSPSGRAFVEQPLEKLRLTRGDARPWAYIGLKRQIASPIVSSPRGKAIELRKVAAHTSANAETGNRAHTLCRCDRIGDGRRS